MDHGQRPLAERVRKRVTPEMRVGSDVVTGRTDFHLLVRVLTCPMYLSNLVFKGLTKVVVIHC